MEVVQKPVQPECVGLGVIWGVKRSLGESGTGEWPDVIHTLKRPLAAPWEAGSSLVAASTHRETTNLNCHLGGRTACLVQTQAAWRACDSRWQQISSEDNPGELQMAILHADRLNPGSRKRGQLLFSRSGKNGDRV